MTKPTEPGASHDYVNRLVDSKLGPITEKVNEHETTLAVQSMLTKTMSLSLEEINKTLKSLLEKQTFFDGVKKAGLTAASVGGAIVLADHTGVVELLRGVLS